MTETAILKTAAHELTHFIQANSAQYEALKSFVVNKLTHEGGVSFEDLVADKQRREPGLEYDEAVDEVVADACEMILGDSTVVEQLAKENRSLAEKIRDWLREWVENLKIALEGLQADRTESRAMMQYARELQEIWDNALVDAARNNRGTAREAAPAESRQQARVGTDEESGKPIYQANFPKGTPKAAKAQRILSLIQNVWSKKPIFLVVQDADGSARTIEARFDPTYIEEEGVQTDAKKLMGGNRHGTSGEQRVTLDLADDYYEIAAESTYNYSKSEMGKSSATHKGVKQWHYFINDILFQECGEKETTPYRVTINVKERSDGEFVYSFSAERQNERSSTRRTLHADDTQSAKGGESNAQPSVNSIRQSNDNSQEKSSDKVQSSMRDSAGRELTEAQQAYFKDSKVRDADGKLLVMYHQTDGTFTVFDTKHKGAGTGDDETPFGIFLKRTSRNIGVRGEKQMELYADIRNPLRVRDRTELVSKLRELSADYARLKDESAQIDKEYEAKFEEAKNAFKSFLIQWRKNNPDAPPRAAYDADGFDAAFNAEDNVVKEWTRKKDELALRAKTSITQALRDNGYDGVILENDKGSWGRSTDAYIALDANQVKNTTNKTPTADPDIRYSVRENLPNEIDSWAKDGMPEGVRFTLGSTGPVLQGLGAIESDIYMEGDKIRKILQDHPEMTLVEIKKVPQILEDPALILKSEGPGKSGANSRLVCFGLTKAQNGQPVMTVMDLRPRENGFVVDDMQKVNSAYTKKNPMAFVQKSDVVYADKKRAIPLLRTTGLTISSQQLLRNGYIGSISYKGGSVNIQGVPFSSVVKIEMKDKAQNQQRDPRLSDRDVLRMAADMAQRDRSQRWSVEDLNRFDLLQRKLLQLDEANAELEALKEERKVLLAGRKVKELTRDEQFDLAQNRNRTETQKGKMFINRLLLRCPYHVFSC